MNFTSLHRHSLGATWRTKAAAIFNETKHHVDHHMPPLPPTPANEKKRRRNRTENKHGSSKHASPAKISRTLHKNRPQSPSARSPIKATAARPRNSTAPLLSNKRVGGVVHGGNGLLHLRPRLCTYSAITRNPRRCRHRYIGAFCLHSKRSAGRRNWQSTVCRDWPRQRSRERGKKRRCVWL